MRAHRLHTPEEEEAQAEVAVAMVAHFLSKRLKEVTRDKAVWPRRSSSRGVVPERTQAGDALVAEGRRSSIPETVEARGGLTPDR